MKRRVWVAGFALAFGMGALTAATVRADDEKKPEGTEKEKPDAPPVPATIGSGSTARFTGQVHVADIHGEVVSATDSSVTVRIYYLAPSTTGNRGRGGYSRPHIGRGGSSMLHPSRRGPGVKWVHHDYTFDYHPDGMARTRTLPKKTDADGKKLDYTSKELEALKEPAGFPGYAMNKADIVPGAIVDVSLLRDRAIPAAKATETDLKIKWIKVTGQAATPPAATTANKANPKKKKM